MFKRRDIPPVLLLLLLIILVMLTLSQILVVHNGRYGKNVHNMRKLQLELREMDINLHSLMMQNVPSIELNRRLLQNEINAGRIRDIIAQAAKRQRPRLDRSQNKQQNRSLAADGSWDRSRQNTSILPQTRKQEDMTLFNHSHDAYSSQISDTGRFSSSTRQLDLHVNSSKIQRFSNKIVPSMQNITDPSALSIPLSTSHNIQSQHFPLKSNLPSETLESSRHSTHANQHVLRQENLQTQIIKDTLLPSRTLDLLDAELPESLPNIQGSVLSKTNVISRTTLLGRHHSSSTKAKLKKEASHINYCPSIPPNLKGQVFVNFNHKHNFTEEEIVHHNPHIQPGGMSRPTDCIARHKVAIVVPYRDRWEHLMILLSHLHPILERQQLDYRIFVVEQSGKDTFNKARIMNIAFVEALKQNNFRCFVFHDVDLVPEDDRNMYSCPMQPRHMSVAIDEMGYKLAYQELVGGVLNMRTEHFQRVNGYSNLYWGWGAEDDDMAYRIMHVGLKITRPPEAVARYKMVKHTKRKPADWRKRAKLLYTGTRRFQFDGLNSLQYRVVHIKKLPLFTHVLVDIGKPPRGF